MKLRIDGGRVLDLTDNQSVTTNVLIDTVAGTILAIGSDIPEGDQQLTLDGETLLPGFVDMHVHLREPGFEDKETIETGSKAAARGGFTQIACMPNTNPSLDSPEALRYVLEKAEAASYARVLPIAAITQGQKGQSLTDFEGLKNAGAVALSDDGKGVQHGGLMREALFQAARLGLSVAIHAEDESIAGSGVLHTNAARRLGLGEIPASAESAMIARDILLAEETGAHIHICHVSAESAVSLVRWAKSRGVNITAEVTPHHLLLTDDIIDRDDAVYKVNPPLRSDRDRRACLEGFLDGTLDMIATDHAPHTATEKNRGITAAPFGMVGIETVFPLLYTYLVVPGYMTLAELAKRMSWNAANAFHLPGGVLKAGGPADFVAVDLTTEHTIDVREFHSKGQNTPFAGWHATGYTRLTVGRGKVIYDKGADAK